MKNVTDFIEQNRDRVLDELREFLRIPSVSTLKEHDKDCRQAATWVATHLERLGCRKVELAGSETHPVVCANGPNVPGKPTLLVYGHYDVQPPDPLALWESAPFDPVIRNGDIVARGATDDKGQVFAVIKAFEAVMSVSDGKPPVNLRFLIEGQEESGGEVVTELLKRKPELVAVDAVLVSDTPYYRKGWPAVYTALRGLCYCEISVRTLKGDLHSGLYGGAAPNAHQVLVTLLAALKGKKGRIHIPGLYDDVVQPTKKERKAWDALPYNEKTYLRSELGAKAIAGSSRDSVFEKTWALPTFEIHGITGGFTGEGAKTVIPAEATAKVSLRLVPRQRAKKVERLLRRAVKNLAPSYADVRVKFIHGGDPVQTDVDAGPVRLMSQAFKEIEGREAVPIRSGGSIPIVPALASKHAPVVLTGIGLPDDRLHAPNEKLNLDQFWTGVRVFGRFFELMGSK
jgi:acetylornithine deacetylase/succinyl-diaminopimelate desuccinylase-like protein